MYMTVCSKISKLLFHTLWAHLHFYKPIFNWKPPDRWCAIRYVTHVRWPFWNESKATLVCLDRMCQNSRTVFAICTFWVSTFTVGIKVHASYLKNGFLAFGHNYSVCWMLISWAWAQLLTPHEQVYHSIKGTFVRQFCEWHEFRCCPCSAGM